MVSEGVPHSESVIIISYPASTWSLPPRNSIPDGTGQSPPTPLTSGSLPGVNHPSAKIHDIQVTPHLTDFPRMDPKPVLPLEFDVLSTRNWTDHQKPWQRFGLITILMKKLRQAKIELNVISSYNNSCVQLPPTYRDNGIRQSCALNALLP